MTTNFDFLKPYDRNLYQIISDAELLYRDGYFEQCMTQTRRFGENVCKKVLGDNRTTEETFDQMLATLKDHINGVEEEKEFVNDLYFLKKCGNKATHSGSVKKDGLNALECLQRAFEVAINYSVYSLKEDKDILQLHFDTKLLATGKKDKSLAKKYQKVEEQEKNRKKKTTEKNNTTTTAKQKKKRKLPQQTSIKSCKKKPKFTPYWIFVSIISVAILFLIIYILI